MLTELLSSLKIQKPNLDLPTQNLIYARTKA